MKKRTAVTLLMAATLTTGAMAATPAMAAEPTTASSVLVTYVHENGSTFKSILNDTDSIAAARDQLAGGDNASHPSGRIVYGAANENIGWTWHLEGTRQVDADIEICDGTPEDVETHAITSTTYCPWGARPIAIQDL
ncbi:hypothetical protein AB0M54_32630 [Actinoplanes sp. NPDC051470]|uniref:BP74-related protein n=1 Tax=unclassified Actinoplanes TaxID=2626549 RepID=UPI003418A2BF